MGVKVPIKTKIIMECLQDELLKFYRCTNSICFCYIDSSCSTIMRYLIMLILMAGCVKSEYGFRPAPPGLTAAIYEQLIKIENDK